MAGGAGAQAVLDRARAVLHARGERMTSPRRQVLLALARRGGHVSAEELVEDVAAGVHRSSVYRTLEALTAVGVVQHVHLGHGGTAYHVVEAAHPHVQCTTCGVVADLPPALLDPLAPLVRSVSGYVLDPVHVALAGTCAPCQARAAH